MKITKQGVALYECSDIEKLASSREISCNFWEREVSEGNLPEECYLIAPKGYHFVGRSVNETDHTMHFTRDLGAGYETKSHWYARVYRELANTEIRLCNANECAYWATEGAIDHKHALSSV
jgi:hypothetical protein